MNRDCARRRVPTPSPSPKGEGSNTPTIPAIQLLRALAAGTVAFVHLAFGFSDHIGGGLGLGRYGGHAAQAAVALFFLVSGYIMVVSSAPLFGARGGSGRFWRRRLVRILPPYWLATGLLCAIFVWLGRAVDSGQLARSLVLWPFWGAGGGQPLPILWPGWTLLHELLFYALFGLGISAGRTRAVGIASAALVALIAAGHIWPPVTAIGFALTRPIALLFIAGMGFALIRGHVWPIWLRCLLAGGAAALLITPVTPAGTGALGFAWLAWAGPPALLLFAAAMGGPLNVARPRTVDTAGRISFALYLLHVPMGWLWAAFYPGFLHGLGAWFHLATLLAATVLASAAFYHWAERPLTRRLNRLLANG